MNVAGLDCFSYRNQPCYINLKLILMRIMYMLDIDVLFNSTFPNNSIYGDTG